MNHTVLITGASSGLGKALVLQFANRGYRVFAGVRSQHDAESIGREHPAIVPILLDVSSPSQISRAAEQVTQACGAEGLSLLINNAGHILYSPVEHGIPEQVDHLFDVVSFAPFRLANALLPALKQHARSGRRSKILNILSWAALDANPFVGFYAAAKAAALRLTQAQSLELEPSGIDVVAIVPGLMRTPFVTGAQSQIVAAIARLPAAGRHAYAAYLQHMASMSAGASTNPLAAEPAAIANKVYAVSQRRRPKEQYYFGWDTFLVRLIAALPYWAQRRIKRALFGLNQRPKSGGFAVAA